MAAPLTARALTDTFRNREKGGLKCLYPAGSRVRGAWTDAKGAALSNDRLGHRCQIKGVGRSENHNNKALKKCMAIASQLTATHSITWSA